MDKNSIIRLFMPQKCMFCGKIITADGICGSCKEKTEYLKIPSEARTIKEKSFKNLDSCTAFYYYRDAVRDSILYAKYKNCDRFISGFLKYADFDFAQYCIENNTDVIVSMPAHKSKFYSREYDLPAEMANHIAKNYNLNYNKDLIIKVKRTKNQHDLPLNQRKNNLKDAFKTNADVKGKNILIIDDILTSGNSLEEVAARLKKDGAAMVTAIVFAYNNK